jgi:hypothetical protein
MKNSPTQTAAAIFLLAATIAYRLATGFADHAQWLQNFSPVAAIALCGAIYLPKKLAVALPLIALFVSDLLLNLHYHASLVATEMVSRYVALGLIVAIGWALRERARFATILPASLAGSILFYFITNTGSWLDNPGYAKTAAGWTQALITGIPGYAPTWMFFRSTLVSDLLFTALFVACMAATLQRETSPALAKSLHASA